jgi:glycosyltransferase involved in cell wall biosynthesis
MKILLITSNLPYPPITGGKIRVWHLLQLIAQCHDVTLLSLLDSADDIRFLPHLHQYCTRVETVVKQRQRSRGKLLLRLLRTMLQGQPPRNGVAHYDEMKRRLQEVVSSQSFDIIHIEQSHMAPYIEFIANASNAARLITLYDVGATQYERILKIESNLQQRFWTWLDWLFLRRWEPIYLARHFDQCIVVSPVDRALLHQANPALDLAVVPNGVAAAQCSLLPEAPDSKDILLIGKMGYAPNVDGAIFFCKEILPLVKQQIPNARLLIVGWNPPGAVRALASDDVIVTGYVESVVPYYQRSFVSVIPLRAGGGTRLKILESMALGRPVVSTTTGCEGLAVTHGENILIADTPADFAARTIELLNDEGLRRHLIVNGRRLVETTYDWEVIAQQLLRVYEEVGNKQRGYNARSPN